MRYKKLAVCLAEQNAHVRSMVLAGLGEELPCVIARARYDGMIEALRALTGTSIKVSPLLKGWLVSIGDRAYFVSGNFKAVKRWYDNALSTNPIR